MQYILECIRNKKLILWDFDGCLCDSERTHFLSYQQAFQAYGYNVEEASYYHTFTHEGLGPDYLIEKHKLPCKVQDIRALKEKAYATLSTLPPGLPLFQQVPDLVALWKRWGLQNVIASNSKNQDIETILKLWNSNHPTQPCHLDAVYGLQPGMRKKPSPDIFLYAMEQQGVTPDQALVIEDSHRGLMAAQTAGCHAIWIQTRFNAGMESSANFMAKVTHEDLLNVCSQ